MFMCTSRIHIFHVCILSPSQIERCVVLLRANPGAARRFYQLAVTHLSPAEVAKFILAIHSTVVQCVQGDGSEQGGGGKVVEGKEGEESAAATLGEGVCLCGCCERAPSMCMLGLWE